ncbi:MAG: HAD hydrolase-like protein [Clostridia bacterium]|nr:HAD hydrolase-like protein [Clostridia bacterium]
MKYIFDLDETLIQSTTLNNDAYNYALEKFGFKSIITSERLML